MKNMLKVGISYITPEALVSKASTLLLNMTGNANFPDPTPSLAALTSARDALQAAISEAAFGDRQKISVRQARYDELSLLINRLAGYVNSMAAGNAAVIVSSGFELRRANTPAPPVTNPVDLRAIRTDKQGTVMVQWSPVRASRSYVVEMTTTDPAEENTQWTIVSFTTRTKIEVDGLAIGKFYWFRVKAVGNRDNSGFSDVALVMAA